MLTLPGKNLLAAAFCILLGGYVAWGGWGYSIGTLSNIGPGFFPFALGSILVLCGLGVGAQALREVDAAVSMSLRPYLAIPGAIILFALTINRLGVIPAVVLTTAVASLADRSSTVRGTLLLVAGLVVLVYVVFVMILRIPLDPITWRF